MPDSPSQLMEKLVQQHVTLRLKDNRALSGKLLGLDEHLNIVLEDAEETTDTVTRRLGKVVLRGSNVISLTGVGATPRK
jgi:small nuclear ribonucleoprotein